MASGDKLVICITFEKSMVLSTCHILPRHGNVRFTYGSVFSALASDPLVTSSEASPHENVMGGYEEKNIPEE
jgi:hypothetical protein